MRQCAFAIGQDDGGDRTGLVAAEPVAVGLQGAVEAVDIVPEAGSQIGAGNDLGQRGAGRGDDCRRGRCRENIRPCGQPQQFQLGVRAGADPADAAQALGKGTDDEVDVVGGAASG